MVGGPQRPHPNQLKIPLILDWKSRKHQKSRISQFAWTKVQREGSQGHCPSCSIGQLTQENTSQLTKSHCYSSLSWMKIRFYWLFHPSGSERCRVSDFKTSGKLLSSNDLAGLVLAAWISGQQPRSYIHSFIPCLQPCAGVSTAVKKILSLTDPQERKIKRL